MPWIALPFDESKINEKLNEKYNVEGIPTLIVVDQSGKTITTDGRSEI